MLQRSYCLLEMPAPRNALQAQCCSFCIRHSIACPALMKRRARLLLLLALAGESRAHRSGPRHGLFAVTLPQWLYLEKIPHRLPMPRAVMAVQNIAHLLPGVVHRAVDLLNRQSLQTRNHHLPQDRARHTKLKAESDMLTRCLVGTRSTLPRSKSRQTEGPRTGHSSWAGPGPNFAPSTHEYIS
jgi:hypothetical protein